MRATASKSDAKKEKESKHPPAIEQIARNATVFQRREWIAQRIGWVLLTLVLLAALTGVFGRGPLADQTLENPVALLEYERFVRRHADTRWEFTIRRVLEGSPTEIAVDAAFAANFEVTDIQPRPDRVALSGGRWVYQFDVRDAGEGRVVFIVEPEQMGRHAGTITVDGAPPFTLSQFTYP